MPDELLDVVNDHDVVTAQVMRSLVHEKGLQHRGVHVFLFTRDGKLLVQKRSADRAASPSLLDCSVSEHVKAGESYERAAIRGLYEELSVTAIDIRPVVKFKMKYGPNDFEISWLYHGLVNPTSVRFDPLEIEQVSYRSLSELSEMIHLEEKNISYWFKQLIQWYTGTPSDMSIMEIESDVRLFS